VRFFSFRGDRNARALKNKESKQIDDDANDFNEDLSIVDAFSKSGIEGNIAAEDEGRGKKMKGNKQGYGGYGDEGYYGYGYGKLTQLFDLL
jgi:hypothetical protein